MTSYPNPTPQEYLPAGVDVNTYTVAPAPHPVALVKAVDVMDHGESIKLNLGHSRFHGDGALTSVNL